MIDLCCYVFLLIVSQHLLLSSIHSRHTYYLYYLGLCQAFSNVSHLYNLMTLIDSQAFHNLAIALGTSLFAALVFWAFWYASKMD